MGELTKAKAKALLKKTIGHSKGIEPCGYTVYESWKLRDENTRYLVMIRPETPSRICVECISGGKLNYSFYDLETLEELEEDANYEGGKGHG